MKTLMAALALLSASPLLAAPLTETSPPVEHYRYGMVLDIAQVISITRLPNTCGIVPVTMVYRDNHGQLHRLQYSALGAGCSRH
ncbi:MAG: hypothetical protein GAK45_00262 [Pseudomonas citronellolis]|nr:MAG: hypothetical protein GAK45_00262 [Pseudomonas citronellolis]